MEIRLLNQETKHHYKMYKRGKQWIYASLATVTLLSGLGATPSILAAEVTDSTTEPSTSVLDTDSQVPSNEDAAPELPVITAPDALPAVDLHAVTVPDKVTAKAPNQAPTKKVAASTNTSTAKVTNSKTDAKQTVVPEEKKVSTTKAKAPRDGVAHTFTIGDLNMATLPFQPGYNAFQGFSDNFINNYYPTWDGALNFPAGVGLETVGHVNSGAWDGTKGRPQNRITSVDFSTLVGLSYFSPNVFGDHPSSLNHITVPKLPNLTAASIYAGAFIDVAPGGIVTPKTADAVATAQLFVDNINNGNNFTGVNRWNISGSMTYKYVDENNTEIATAVTEDGLLGDSYTAPATPSVPGYGNPQLAAGSSATGNLTGGPQETTYQYQTKTKPFTISYVDIHGQTISNPLTTSGVIDDITVADPYISDAFDLPQETITDDPDLANYVYKELQRSTDDGGWESIMPANLPATYAENDGHNYRFVYSELSTVTQMYLDEAGNQIQVDSDHRTIRDENGTAYDYTFAADTDDFYANGAPKLTGYDEPELTANSAPVTGNIVYTEQKIVIYQYKTIAKPGMIYRVDTNGQEIADPEPIAGHITDSLTLRSAVDGYTLKELYFGDTAATTKSRKVPTLNWQRNDALADTTFSLGTNAGHSYKLVYAKNTPGNNSDKTNTGDITPPAKTETPNDNNGTTPPPVSDGGGSTATAQTGKPSKKPTPSALPASGGNNSNPNTTSTTSAPKTAEKHTTLPKSGKITNYVITVLGMLVLVGAFGMAWFNKKRKS
ncbi:LPXTG cell wall anchor domain-containing protein [Periweissella cryptocerci]|uniref:LPXTG cell wall anchor domain-containing protein n=1 Tax=Periweissella cryptocerci TaxID=2506420 RepID=A0A4P6YRM9_9LACO|nr:MucBP domain-containing protein [Periweissella cryptocerci]QBO35253.1 LPXTG cell wall anchor domain-containing protein [Periweissella cryptocerci]